MASLILRTIVFTLFLSTSAWACGGSCSGGGSTIKISPSSPWILVDLLTTNELAKQFLPNLSSTSVTAVAHSTICSTPSVEEWSLQNEAVYQELLQTIESQRQKIPIEATSRLFLDLVDRALQKIIFLKYNCQLPLTKKIYISNEVQSLRPQKIATVIMYIPHFGAVISEPIWKQLDQKTQWGLILHESIRQIQMFYNFVDLSDKNLQMIVATMLTEGFSSQNIERYFSPMIRNYFYIQQLTAKADTLTSSEYKFSEQYSSVYDYLFSTYEQSQRNRTQQLSPEAKQRLLQILATEPDSDRSY